MIHVHQQSSGAVVFTSWCRSWMSDLMSIVFRKDRRCFFWYCFPFISQENPMVKQAVSFIFDLCAFSNWWCKILSVICNSTILVSTFHNLLRVFFCFLYDRLKISLIQTHILKYQFLNNTCLHRYIDT